MAHTNRIETSSFQKNRPPKIFGGNSVVLPLERLCYVVKLARKIGKLYVLVVFCEKKINKYENGNSLQRYLLMQISFNI